MRIKSIAVLLTAALLAFGSVSADASFDKDELKCRKGMAKGFLKALSTADKTSSGCHKGRHSGKELPATDCNELGPEPGTPGAADGKGKFAKAQQKLIDTPAKKCVGLDADVLTPFTSCPEPCNTTLGLNNPMISIAEVAQCMACTAGDVVSTKNATLLGAPDPGLMSGDDAKCAQGIAKGYAKYLSTILKTRTKCQDTFEKGGGEGLDATCQTSPDPDGKGKIAKALAKAEGGIDKACTTATLANVGSCSAVDIASLKACAATDSDTADVVGFPLHYEMPATICPIALDLEVKSSVRVDTTVTETDLASGWNGLGHSQDVIDGYLLSTDLTCPSSTPPCGNCTIDGVSPTGAQYDAFSRCREDSTISCSVPFGTDPICPGTQDCSYFSGPPLPTSASNVPTCVLVRLLNDLSGTVNPADGSAEQNLDITAVVHLGDTLTRPCPICEGDTTAQDGVKDGVCNGGNQHGLSCDVQGFSPTFAVGEGTSLDCPPSIDKNISGAGLILNVPQTTGATSMPFGTQCDFPLTGLNCACAMCSGDTTVACNSNTDCSMIAAGTCTSKGSGESRAPNGCSDLNCTAGECLAGENDDNVTYCNQELRANGNGLITCNTNADCDSVSVECGDGSPGACGDCTLVETRKCFNDPISATGTADLNDPVYAATFCTSPTNNIGVNGATGLPGPSRVKIESHTTFRY